jgi:copper chaperone CopZ
MKESTAESAVVANAIFSLYSLGCSSCSGLLESKLKKLPGITEVNVNYVADMVAITFDPRKVTSDDIRTFMKKLGSATALHH